MARTIPYDASAKLTPANAVTLARLLDSEPHEAEVLLGGHAGLDAQPTVQ